MKVNEDLSKEEQLWNRDKQYFNRLQQIAKKNLINDLKNTDLGKQIFDYDSYIKKPSKIKILMKKLNNFFRML